MRKTAFFYATIVFCCFGCIFVLSAVAQNATAKVTTGENVPAAKEVVAATPVQAATKEEPVKKEEISLESIEASENVTLDFKDADIHNVLKILSYKAGINIVTTPDVAGTVTIRLVDVPWETALDVILKSYGFGYQRQGNIILVTKQENMSKIQAEEALQTEIISLKFLDAQDAQKILIPLLSPRGRISVLYSRGQKGWQFGSFKIGKGDSSQTGLVKEKEDPTKLETVSIEKSASGDMVARKAEFQPSIKSRTLVITDTAASLDRIRNTILPVIDRRPKQVLIETRLIEVSRDKLRDLGVDFGTGSTGATTAAVGTVPAGKSDGRDTAVWGGQSVANTFTPSAFGAKEGASVLAGANPFALGAEFIYQKLTGTQFEVVLHALEEDVHTNTLSAPRILTLDNQEAAILVGFHTPILSSVVTAGSTSGTGATVTQSLDYYQEIGIRLNVVPQVNEEGYINMIIHPSITSTSSSVSATSTASGANTTTSYPIIDVREAQTQVLLKDGETIVIGGLLKDVKSKQTSGVPFLSAIPIIGGLFRRDTYDTQKIDLLMFITARVLKEGEFNEEEIAKLEKSLSTETEKGKPTKQKSQKK